MEPQNTTYPHAEFKVGDRANICRHSDIDPATVVEVRRNGDEVVLRVDSFKLAEGQKPEMVPGGFCAHCTNQRELVYDITENLAGNLETFTLRLWRGRYCWTPKGGTPNGHQHCGTGWSAFYDYNF